QHRTFDTSAVKQVTDLDDVQLQFFVALAHRLLKLQTCADGGIDETNGLSVCHDGCQAFGERTIFGDRLTDDHAVHAFDGDSEIRDYDFKFSLTSICADRRSALSHFIFERESVYKCMQ